MSAKRNVRVAAREAMQKFDYDPLAVLVLHAQDPQVPNGTKIEIAQVLLPYMYPKLSNVTVEGELNTGASVASQAILLRRILENPELADAAQRLSLAAAETALEVDMGDVGMVQ